LLLDSQYPIWLAVFEDEAVVSVDTELMAGGTRRRFQAAVRYIEFLRDRGYSTVFDNRARTRIEPELNGSGIVRQLASIGSTRLFDRIREERWSSFIATSIAVGLVAALINYWSDRPRPVWYLLLNAIVIGIAITAMQEDQVRRSLTARLEQLRLELLSGIGPAERLTFRRPRRALWMEIFAVVLFGGFAAISLAGSEWWVKAILLPAFILASASLLLRSQLRVTLDRRWVEGLSLTGRVRIAYSDIHRIVQMKFPGLTAISDGRRTIWAVDTLEHYLQLVDELWNRSNDAQRSASEATTLSLDSALTSLQGSIDRARVQLRFRWQAWTAMLQPMWLWLFARNYPLRRQFSWHRHLLRRGHLTFGLVIESDPCLANPQRTDEAHDSFCVVLVAPEISTESMQPLLEGVAARIPVGDGDPQGIIEESSDVEMFLEHLKDVMPFPSFVEVPRALTDGHLVYCTSVLVVLRDIPLGILRSRWVPLLIDPTACPFSMIVPMQYWDQTRRQWEAGDPSKVRMA
jgi:hypothetical protein